MIKKIWVKNLVKNKQSNLNKRLKNSEAGMQLLKRFQWIRIHLTISRACVPQALSQRIWSIKSMTLFRSVCKRNYQGQERQLNSSLMSKLSNLSSLSSHRHLPIQNWDGMTTKKKKLIRPTTQPIVSPNLSQWRKLQVGWGKRNKRLKNPLRYWM